jgi:glycosyltransferase involved in cell wall biosynthesis
MTLYNGFDPDDILADPTISLPTDKINIVHTGRLGLSRPSRGVQGFVEALHILIMQLPTLAEKCQFHFVGGLSKIEQDYLAPLVNYGVVKLWGNQSRAVALGFQNKADILLLITAPDKASIATGKLFEYIAAKRPILALTRGTAAAEIVYETGTGIVVPPDEPLAIADVISQIIFKKKLNISGRNEAKILEFNRKSQMQLLAEKLNLC